MSLPQKIIERKFLKAGYQKIIAVDEVGMGSLAGPVVVCAIMFNKNFFKKRHPKLYRLRDSKTLSARQREFFAKNLTNIKDLCYRISYCFPVTIDRLNIYQAARLAMKRAIKKLFARGRPGDTKRKMPKTLNQKSKIIVLIDGPNKITGLDLKQVPIVKGDRKVLSIACASIIAKVTRDRIMTRLAKRYPQYGLEKHKGYSTKLHKAMLAQHGICEIHRKSFRPVAKLL